MDGQAIRKAETQSIKSLTGAPFRETIHQETQLSLATSPGSRKFGVRCHAANAGHLEVASDSVSVRIEQKIRNDGKEELWGSLLIETKEQDDGSLVVEVVVFHPEWDEPLRIASLRSNPSDRSTPEPNLVCDFERRHL